MKLSCAFQPIVNVADQAIFSYEALVRGENGESAYEVISAVSDEDLIEFDQKARETAMKMAHQLGIKTAININFLPRSIYNTDEYVCKTLKFAEAHGFKPSQLYLEVTEQEAIQEQEKFVKLANEYHGLGLNVAIDDFGAGYSGLNLLAEFPPDLVKLDIALIKAIHQNGPKQTIVKAIIQVCFDLGIDLLAEGVETVEEYRWLKNHGIEIFQGFLFAKPGLGKLPKVNFPKL